MNNPNQKMMNRLLYIIVVIVVAVCVYNIVSAARLASRTGVLKVSSSDAKATLSISQPDHDAKFIGVGSARVRVAPGEYQVVGSEAGNQASTTVIVSNKQTATATIHPSQATTLPSVGNINFQGTSRLVSSGLTTGQVNNLKAAFFKFKISTKSVIIDASSVTPGPIDHTTSNFTLNFNVSVDGVSYAATATYAVSDQVQLILFNPQTKAQVFNYGNPS